MINLSKKLLVPVGILLVAILFSLSIYTFGICIRSYPLKQIQTEFSTNSVIGATQFLQSDTLSYGTNGTGDYLTYAAAGSAENLAEMFLIHNQPFLCATRFPRFVVDAHYTAEQPVGFACEVLENVNGETVPIGFLFSSNHLGISEIQCHFKDSETSHVQLESFGVEWGNPFAEAFSLDSENMEIEFMICYDYAGNIVYTVGL